MKDGRLELKDAPMFGRVMCDPQICKEVLERFLGIQIERIEYLNAEQALDPATSARGVRLDVFARGSGKVFDIEMQVTPDEELGKRLRYYQASIDQACLDKGDDYGRLEESHIIFVCDFDPFGRALPAYHLERVCAEDDSITIGDRSHWLVLNAHAWRHDLDAGRSGLLHYIHANAAADDELIQRIDDAVQRANDDAEWRSVAMGFMTVEHDHRVRMRQATERGLREGLERGLEEGREQGLEQGLEQGQALYAGLVDKLLAEGRLEDLKRSAEDAAFRNQLLEELLRS